MFLLNNRKFKILFFYFVPFLIILFINIKYLEFYSKSVLNTKYDIDKIFDEPIIFIGGFMSSGTTLLRSILDVHPLVKCGPETKITYELFEFIKKLKNEKSKYDFIRKSGLNESTINKAVGIFVYYIYLKNVNKTKYICNKEPNNVRYIELFQSIFPNSKFIYIIRDGRDVSYSLLKRRGHLPDFINFKKYLESWNKQNKEGYRQCLQAGPNYCKIIKYEDLVKNTKLVTINIANFLNIFWTNKFLNHQKYIDKDIKVAENEWSLNKIKNKINTDSIGNWIGKIENYDQEYINNSFLMLKVFNYI